MSYKVEWTLESVLKAHGITPYRLVKQLEGRVSLPTIYSAVNGTNGGAQLSTIAGILSGLEELTGQRFTVCDVLHYTSSNLDSEAARPVQRWAVVRISGGAVERLGGLYMSKEAAETAAETAQSAGGGRALVLSESEL